MKRERKAASWMAFANDPSLICSSRAWPTSCCYHSPFFEWLTLSSLDFSKQDLSFRVPSKYQVLLAAWVQLPISQSRTISDLLKNSIINFNTKSQGASIILYWKPISHCSITVIYFPVHRDRWASWTEAGIWRTVQYSEQSQGCRVSPELWREGEIPT